MRKTLMAIAVLGAMASQAQAGIVCNSCDYLNGQVATNLGSHNPLLFDVSTFSNAAVGLNGNFSNLWVFGVNPAGATSIDAIFLPIHNISNFDVKLYEVTANACAANTGTAGGACALATLGALLADGDTNPAFATVIDFTALNAGIYAFQITGTINGLVPGQPATYTGNVQVQAIPEPDSLVLAGTGLLAMGTWLRRRKEKAHA